MILPLWASTEAQASDAGYTTLLQSFARGHGPPRGFKPLCSAILKSRVSDPSSTTLQQDHANSTSLVLVWQVPLIHSACNRRRPPVVQIVMQLSVASTELEVVQEQWVVMQCQGVEDVEFGLSHRSYISKRILVLTLA
jgi:hypothetical protein